MVTDVETWGKEIEKIKSKIKSDYIESPNSQWQLGHKNPGSTDNSNVNLVLQPPIQGKYRDNYIFIDIDAFLECIRIIL